MTSHESRLPDEPGGEGVAASTPGSAGEPTSPVPDAVEAAMAALDEVSREALRAHPLALQAVRIAVSMSGPLPSPDVLGAYEPDVQRRIVAMAEAEQRHRHSMHRIDVDSACAQQAGEFRLRRRGQVCGVAIALAAFLGATLMVWASPGVASAVVGTVLGGGALTSLVVAFLKSGESRSPAHAPDPEK